MEEGDMKVKLPEFTCLRCGYVWHPRKEEVPRRCAGCKSPYWNKPKEETKR